MVANPPKPGEASLKAHLYDSPLPGDVAQRKRLVGPGEEVAMAPYRIAIDRKQSIQRRGQRVGREGDLSMGENDLAAAALQMLAIGGTVLRGSVLGEAVLTRAVLGGAALGRLVFDGSIPRGLILRGLIPRAPIWRTATQVGEHRERDSCA